MEYCEYGSLQNLIKSIGLIPEHILKDITHKILNAIELYSIKTDSLYSSLCPNNILFDSEFNIKVSINLYNNRFKDITWHQTTLSQI